MNKVKIKATPAQSHVKIQYEGEELTIKELVGKLKYLKGSQEYLKWAVVEKVYTSHTTDGVWRKLPIIGRPTVTHWMPLPEPPEDKIAK